MLMLLKRCLPVALLPLLAGCLSDSGPQFSAAEKFAAPGAGMFSGVPQQWEPDTDSAGPPPDVQSAQRE